MNGISHSSNLNKQNLNQDIRQYFQQNDKSKENPQIISYGECKKGGFHDGEVLNCVCIDESCGQNELICTICEQEQHQGHQVIPLKVFLESLQNIEDKRFKNKNYYGKTSPSLQSLHEQNGKDGWNLNHHQDWNQIMNNNLNNSNGLNDSNNNRNHFALYLEEIDRYQQITIKYFQDYQKKVLEGFDECFNKINHFYKTIKLEIKNKKDLEETCFQKVLQSLTSYSQVIQKATKEMAKPFTDNNVHELVNTLQSEQRNPRRNNKISKGNNMGKNLSEVLKIVGFDQNDGFKSYYKLDLDNVISQCDQRYQKLMTGKDADTLLTQLNTLVSKCDSLYSEIPQLSILTTTHFKGQGLSAFLKQLKFSDKFKGTSIQIKSPTIAQQTQNESSGQRFCLLEPNLPHSSRLRWGFKIKSLVGWIGIGICIAGIIKGFSYQFKYSKIGHGSYLLSGNGYTWSHSKTAQNSQNKSFHFITGDSIYLEFDPSEKKLKFQKGKSNESYVLELDFIASDEIVPCVNLCSSGDEIELIVNEAELNALNF